MAADSAHEGVLTSVPLHGQELNRFLQQWIVSLVGLPGPLVRPAYQAEPPNVPTNGVAWGAFRIQTTRADKFPAFVHSGAGQGSDTMQRHETLEVLVSFYDRGTSGQADNLAALLRDGSAVPQNREILTQNGFALIEVGDLTTVPSLLKRIWLYRVDVPMVIRRQVNRTYPVLSLLSMHGQLYSPSPQPIEASPPEPTT